MAWHEPIMDGETHQAMIKLGWRWSHGAQHFHRSDTPFAALAYAEVEQWGAQ